MSSLILLYYILLSCIIYFLPNGNTHIKIQLIVTINKNYKMTYKHFVHRRGYKLVPFINKHSILAM